MSIEVGIMGLGTAVPPNPIDQGRALELAKMFSHGQIKPRILEALYHKSGIQNRASVVAADGTMPFYLPPENDQDFGPGTSERMRRFEHEAASLASIACERALKDARDAPEKITHLIVATCTGFFAPGLDVALIKRLSLNPGVNRTQIGFMGCHGALNAMQAARAFATERPDARVLVCAVELCTLHMQYGGTADDVVANALFADGAAAIVVGSADSKRTALCNLSAFGSQLFADSEDAMSWRIGAHGFRMTLSSQVPALIERHLGAWLEGWLARLDTRLEDIAAWVVHPGGPKILDAVQRALALPEEALRCSRAVLSEHGNMSSPTILFILEKMRNAEKITSSPTLVLGFGPGLIVEGALLK